MPIELNPAWHLEDAGDEFRAYDQTGAVHRLTDKEGVHFILRLCSTGPVDIGEFGAFDHCMKDLLSLGILRLVSGVNLNRMEPTESERFIWQLEYFKRFETAENDRVSMQLKLRNARVGILGIGARGAHCAQILCAAGIGSFQLIDGDIVEISNLPRMPMLSYEDVGCKKVSVIERHIRAHNPSILVTTIGRHVKSEADAIAVTKGLDIVILCADQPRLQISRWVGEASMENGFAYVPMAGAWLGPISVPRVSPCYVCMSRFFSASIPDLEGHLRANLQNPIPPRPAYGPSPAWRSALLCDHIIRFLIGADTPLIHTRFKVDDIGRTLDQQLVRYVDCHRCS